MPSGTHSCARTSAFPALDEHDPFDRMLVAQAQTDGLTFFTADGTLLDPDAPWIQDATE